MKFFLSILFFAFVFQFSFSQVNIGLNANVTNQNLTSFVVTPAIDYTVNKNVYTGSFQYVKQSIGNTDTEKYLNLNLGYKYFFKPKIYLGGYVGLNTKYVNTFGIHVGTVRKFYNYLNVEFKTFAEHRSHLDARSIESGLAFILQFRI